MNSLAEYKELIVFDCETTGLDHHTCHIIELAACKYVRENDEFVLKEEMNDLVKINYSLPPRITEITGITDTMLSREGLEERIVAWKFIRDFIHASKEKKLFVAYNAPFDIHFIGSMLERNGFSLPNEADYLDVLTVFKDRAPYPHRLENAISYYKLHGKFQNSHRALDDCLATFEVLRQMALTDDDLDKYVNLFGFNPRYDKDEKVKGVNYKAQPYGSTKRLYQ